MQSFYAARKSGKEADMSHNQMRGLATAGLSESGPSIRETKEPKEERCHGNGCRAWLRLENRKPPFLCDPCQRKEREAAEAKREFDQANKLREENERYIERQNERQKAKHLSLVPPPDPAPTSDPAPVPSSDPVPASDPPPADEPPPDSTPPAAA